MTIEKPPNAVFKRMYAGKATPEEKQQIQAYLRSRRAVTPSKSARNRRRKADGPARKAKRLGKVPVTELTTVDVFPGVWTVREHTEDEEYQVAAYERTGKALVSYRDAGEGGDLLTPKGDFVDSEFSTRSTLSDAWHRDPGAAFQAIADHIGVAIWWDLPGGGLRFEPRR